MSIKINANEIIKLANQHRGRIIYKYIPLFVEKHKNGTLICNQKQDRVYFFVRKDNMVIKGKWSHLILSDRDNVIDPTTTNMKTAFENFEKHLRSLVWLEDDITITYRKALKFCLHNKQSSFNITSGGYKDLFLRFLADPDLLDAQPKTEYNDLDLINYEQGKYCYQTVKDAYFFRYYLELKRLYDALALIPKGSKLKVFAKHDNTDITFTRSAREIQDCIAISFMFDNRKTGPIQTTEIYKVKQNKKTIWERDKCLI